MHSSHPIELKDDCHPYRHGNQPTYELTTMLVSYLSCDFRNLWYKFLIEQCILGITWYSVGWWRVGKHELLSICQNISWNCSITVTCIKITLHVFFKTFCHDFSWENPTYVSLYLWFMFSAKDTHVNAITFRGFSRLHLWLPTFSRYI